MGAELSRRVNLKSPFRNLLDLNRADRSAKPSLACHLSRHRHLGVL